MDEMTSLEARTLDAAIESGKAVKIIMVNGYQATATILDFDCNVILARVNGQKWMVYRHAVSTIVMI